MDSPTSITDQTPKEKPVVITSSGSKKAMFKFSLVNPKLLGAMTVLLLLIGGIGTGVYLIQKPQQTTTRASLPIGVDLTLKPGAIEAETASEFNLDIYADAHGNQITSTDLSLQYDPAVLTLKSISPGQFLPKILIPPQINSGSAFVSLGTDGNSGASGNGIIAGLVFEATSSASSTTTDINFDSAKTRVQVLNRSSESAQDTLRGTKVNIKALNKTSKSTQTSSSPILVEENLKLSTPSGSAAKENSDTDFNGDGLTNSIDLSIMYGGWGNPETDVQKRADLNKDGVINGLDYSKVLPKFKL